MMRIQNNTKFKVRQTGIMKAFNRNDDFSTTESKRTDGHFKYFNIIQNFS